MDQEQNDEEKKLKKRIRVTSIRVLKSTAKSIEKKVKELNKKPLGRNVQNDDLILKSLSLLEDKDFEEIKETTLSNTDRLEIRFREFCKNHGPITKDEFIGKLIAGEL